MNQKDKEMYALRLRLLQDGEREDCAAARDSEEPTSLAVSFATEEEQRRAVDALLHVLRVEGFSEEQALSLATHFAFVLGLDANHIEGEARGVWRVPFGNQFPRGAGYCDDLREAKQQ